MEKYLDDAVYIMVTKESYDLLQKYKEEELKSNPAHLGDIDAPLENNPFFNNAYEYRLLQFRYHLLKALGFEEDVLGWCIEDKEGYISRVEHEIIKAGTDTEFLDAIEATGVKVDFKLK